MRVNDLTKKERAKYDRIRRDNGARYAAEWLAAKDARREAAGTRSRVSRRKISPAPSAGGLLTGVPKCAAEFGSLVANPFTAQHNACLPIYPNPPSYKMTTWVKGNALVGTAGYGSVASIPEAGMTNDQACVYYTLANWPNATVSGSATVAGENTVAYANSPYAYSQYGSADTKLQFRLVAHGLRVKYTGTELNRGGAIVGLAQPRGEDLSLSTMTELLSNAAVHTVTFDEDGSWLELTWAPDDADYKTTGAISAASLAFLWNGISGNSMAFEAYWHYEIIGVDAAIGATGSHPAPRQAMAVMDASASMPGVSTASMRVERVTSALRSTAEVTTAAAQAAAGVGTALVTLNNLRKYLYPVATTALALVG